MKHIFTVTMARSIVQESFRSASSVHVLQKRIRMPIVIDHSGGQTLRHVRHMIGRESSPRSPKCYFISAWADDRLPGRSAPAAPTGTGRLDAHITRPVHAGDERARVRAAPFTQERSIEKQVGRSRHGAPDRSTEDAVEDATVIHPRYAAGLVWQHRPDGSPFLVGDFVAHDSAPFVRGSESWLGSQAQWAPADGMAAMCPRADALCSL